MQYLVLHAIAVLERNLRVGGDVYTSDVLYAVLNVTHSCRLVHLSQPDRVERIVASLGDSGAGR